MKFLSINPIRHLQKLHAEDDVILKKEIKENLNKW